MTSDKRADLLALAERVEGGSGEDRRIDYEVFTTFAVRDAAKFWDPKSGHHYTTSLDAVVALLERVLPGWHGNVEVGAVLRDEAKAHSAVLIDPTENPDLFQQSEAKTPARALLAAVLRALATQEGQSHG